MERNQFITHTRKIKIFQDYFKGFETLKEFQKHFTELANQKNIDKIVKSHH